MRPVLTRREQSRLREIRSYEQLGRDLSELARTWEIEDRREVARDLGLEARRDHPVRLVPEAIVAPSDDLPALPAGRIPRYHRSASYGHLPRDLARSGDSKRWSRLGQSAADQLRLSKLDRADGEITDRLSGGHDPAIVRSAARVYLSTTDPDPALGLAPIDPRLASAVSRPRAIDDDRLEAALHRPSGRGVSPVAAVAKPTKAPVAGSTAVRKAKKRSSRGRRNGRSRKTR